MGRAVRGSFVMQMPKPMEQPVKDLHERFRLEGAEPMEGSNGRKARDALHQECAGLEEGDAHCNLKR